MKKDEVQIGATYQVSVTGKLAPVRIVRENPHGGWNGVNVDTKREVRIKSAQRLRKRLDAAPRARPSERRGVPPTTPDVDAKVQAAEDAAETAQAAAQDAPGAAKPTEASKDAGARAGRATGDPGAKGGQPVAEGGKAMSLMDAAVNILSQGTGDPMRCKDIVDLAVKRGLWAPRTGKTPASTLYAAILREIVTKGEASRFVKTERGKFALKDSVYAREIAAKQSPR
jgi:hypothetical protein